MKYQQLHNEAASQYRTDQKNNKEWLEMLDRYAIRMKPAQNEFNSNVHLSCYIPKKVRQRYLRLFFFH
jgi:hypothetical protein